MRKRPAALEDAYPIDDFLTHDTHNHDRPHGRTRRGVALAVATLAVVAAGAGLALTQKGNHHRSGAERVHATMLDGVAMLPAGTHAEVVTTVFTNPAHSQVKPQEVTLTASRYVVHPMLAMVREGDGSEELALEFPVTEADAEVPGPLQRAGNMFLVPISALGAADGHVYVSPIPQPGSRYNQLNSEQIILAGQPGTGVYRAYSDSADAATADLPGTLQRGSADDAARLAAENGYTSDFFGQP
ncbi:MAG TPA: hypothetical protein VLE99_05515 [Candidatus Saccharimonadales bacterium]|nr:hypothetical protein [Candidatus Saccharimonadales bacterium]